MPTYEIVTLNEGLDLNSFSCVNEDVVKFLREKARIEEKDNITKIFVIQIKDRAIAYVALFCSHYRYRPRGYSFEFRVPGLCVGQLGVDRKFERMGLGSILLEYCISLAMEIRKYAGCRILYVEAYDDAIEFYKKNFFALVEKKPNRNKMIFDLNTSKAEK